MMIARRLKSKKPEQPHPNLAMPFRRSSIAGSTSQAVLACNGLLASRIDGRASAPLDANDTNYDTIVLPGRGQ
jgi:hypothetical protein